MGLLDFDEHYKPPYTSRRAHKDMREEERLTELNNEGREVVAPDFSDSPFADRFVDTPSTPYDTPLNLADEEEPKW